MQSPGEASMDSKINGFTPDQALEVFHPAALNEAIVGPWVFLQLHPGIGWACPDCGEVIKSDRAAASFRSGGRVCCPSCKKFFTNRTNTILHGSQLEFSELYLIAVLSAFAKRTGADPAAARREIARISGLHPDSIRNWEKIFTALETPLV
jgi:hypothetical protein